jgi:hypothetical protein
MLRQNRRTDVFVSYSRQALVFAGTLSQMLRDEGFAL